MSWQRLQKSKQRTYKRFTEKNAQRFVQTTPPKNRVFCNECARKKLLFESEGKALTYIKYNANEIEEINGFAPNRAYYCESCGGWHVTHKEDRPEFSQTPTQRAIQAYHKSIASISVSWQDVEYAGVFLDDEGKEKLMKYIQDSWFIPQEGLNICLDHITLYHNSAFRTDSKKAAEVMKQIDKMIMNNETHIKVRVNAFGIIDGKVAAFRIATQLPSTNETLHITIGTYNDGKPFDSNLIDNWSPLMNGVRVSGVIKKVVRPGRNFLG